MKKFGSATAMKITVKDSKLRSTAVLRESTQSAGEESMKFEAIHFSLLKLAELNLHVMEQYWTHKLY